MVGCGDDGSAASESDASSSQSSVSSASDTSSGSTSATSGGTDGAATTTDEMTSAGSDSSDSSDTSDTSDSGSGAAELLAALDGTTWFGEQTREGTTRAYQLSFDTGSLLWSEIRNPYGPARVREMRAFMVMDDGASVHSTVIQPQGWPVHPENGRQDDWTVELLDGAPRVLRTTRDGAVEEFEEGAWPPPEGGLTATVRTFEGNGVIDEAFCDSGLGGFEYKTLFDFAHGLSEEVLKTDVVAGARLLTWTDPTNNNQFSINDIDGFDRLGGTELTDSFNFFVTYTGSLSHPGGSLAMREEDDSVEDALWVFLDENVGSDNEQQLFLEVQGFAWPDKTPDEPVAAFAPGDTQIEAILIRCTEQIKDVSVEISVADGPWALVGDVATTPVINDELFPPAL
jgi:hypothetical protein